MDRFAAEKRDFIKILEGLNSGKRSYELFRQWLEIAFYYFHQIPYNAGELPKDNEFQEIEARYLSLVKNLTQREIEGFGELILLTVHAFQKQPFGDFLGELYMLESFASKRAGQFFTPYAVSLACAKMNLFGIEELIKERGIVRINDPACGAGSMLIAAAEVIAEMGYHPATYAQFYAEDIDPMCFWMTYIQFSAMSLQGVVSLGDTLRLKFHETRLTMNSKFFNQWVRVQKEEQQRKESVRRLFGLITDELLEAPQSIRDSSLSDNIETIAEQRPLLQLISPPTEIIKPKKPGKPKRRNAGGGDDPSQHQLSFF